MSNYSEEGSEANVDEDLLRDLDSLRQVLEEEDTTGAREEGDEPSTSLAERPLEGLQLCLHKNLENQDLYRRFLNTIDKALELNEAKRHDLARPLSSQKRKFTFWKFYRGSYFKDHKGESAPSSQSALQLYPGGPRNFYFNDNVWLKHREDVKLLDGVRLQAIEKRSQPLLEKLESVKSNDELKSLRRQVSQLSQLPDDELVSDCVDIDWCSLSYTQFKSLKSESDCRLHWENYVSPKVYKGPWSKEEEKRLMKLAKQHQCTDWKKIAEEIGTSRSAFACLKHYEELFNPSSIQKLVWTPEMEKRLREGVKKHGVKNWRAVAEHVGHGYSHNQCLHRWFNSANPEIKKGRWSEEEDKLLKEAIKVHGTKWSLVACTVPSRTATQCRERWVNVLDTSINRGKWEKEEDEKLINICKKYEGASIPWAKVALEMGNRTDAMCSTRWKCLSTTPQVVKQFALRVAKKALTKKTHLSAGDIEEGMLPDEYKEQVEQYRHRLVNFHAKRRKGSTMCPSPEMVLREKGAPMFTNKPSCSPLVSSALPSSSVTAAATSTGGGGLSEDGRQSNAGGRKRTASHSTTPTAPLAKRRRPTRRSSATSSGVSNRPILPGVGHQDDMMRLTEHFMQQHLANVMMAPLPLLTQQQLVGYTPTSTSLMGIPIWTAGGRGGGDGNMAASTLQSSQLQLSSMQQAQAAMAWSQQLVQAQQFMQAQQSARQVNAQVSTSAQNQTSAQTPLSPRAQGLMRALNLSRAQAIGIDNVQSLLPQAPSVPVTTSRQSRSTGVSGTSPASDVVTITEKSSASSQNRLEESRVVASSPATTSATIQSPSRSPTQLSLTFFPSNTARSINTSHSSTKSFQITSSFAASSLAPTSPIRLPPSLSQVPASHGNPSSSNSSSDASQAYVFPRGPSHITLTPQFPTAPSLTRATVPSPRTNSGTPSSFIQPHSSLLAPNVRQIGSGDVRSHQHRQESECNPERESEPEYSSENSQDMGCSSGPESESINRPLRVSSPLNVDHPVGAAISALLSLSDRTNSRSPRRFISSPLALSSSSPVRGRGGHFTNHSQSVPVVTSAKDFSPTSETDLRRSDNVGSVGGVSYATATTRNDSNIVTTNRGSSSSLATPESLSLSSSMTTDVSRSISTVVGGDSSCAPTVERNMLPSMPGGFSKAPTPAGGVASPKVGVSNSSSLTSSDTSASVVTTEGTINTNSTVSMTTPPAPLISTCPPVPSKSTSPPIISKSAHLNPSAPSRVDQGASTETLSTEQSSSLADLSRIVLAEVLTVPESVQCSDCLTQGSETIKLAQEPLVDIVKVDGPSLIATNEDDDDVEITGFSRESSVESSSSSLVVQHENVGLELPRFTPSPQVQSPGRGDDSSAYVNENLELSSRNTSCVAVSPEICGPSVRGQIQNSDVVLQRSTRRQQPQRKSATKRSLPKGKSPTAKKSRST